MLSRCTGASPRVRISNSAPITTTWPIRLTPNAPPTPIVSIAIPAIGGKNA